MELLHIAAVSLGSIIVLFILTKILGCRQMSQLSMFDYVNGITIGSIAAEMATSLENDFFKPLSAMVIYAAAALLFSKLSCASICARRLIVGKPVLLYDNGILYFKNMKRANLDLNEFMAQCRVSGYFDLADIKTAILEANGHISFLPKAEARPINLDDFKLKADDTLPAAQAVFSPTQDWLVSNIVIDGNIMTKNLKHTGHDERWLKNQLKAHGISDIRDVFLATCDTKNTVHVYKKHTAPCKFDVLS